MVLIAGIAWGKLETRVNHTQTMLTTDRESTKIVTEELVHELKLIREEIVQLRVVSVKLAQQVDDHILYMDSKK